MSIDPIVLRALLRITGPLTLSDGPVVDTASVIEQMLVRPYLERTPLEQTAMQSDLTPHLFETLLDTPFDVAAWAQALAELVAQGRVSVWSAHADEQAVLAEGPLAGILESRDSLTAQYLRGEKRIPVPASRRRPRGIRSRS